mgnify:CR=1 FL=1
MQHEIKYDERTQMFHIIVYDFKPTSTRYYGLVDLHADGANLEELLDSAIYFVLQAKTAIPIKAVPTLDPEAYEYITSLYIGYRGSRGPISRPLARGVA